ncbi:MAG TPA: response regulator transcription factor [Terriglobales bacterium]|nr:response regulator transcription factor [Terriglobales bacterium]
MAPPLRILLVEDFQPFRRFVCSTLQAVPGLQMVGEVSDGLEATRQAKRLQPDLILLDIGLPTLNGIEAARRIHKLVPECKILFLSQESSADVVQEAFDSGAQGDVVKTHAGSELLPALEAVLEGRQFVSGGLTGLKFLPERANSTASATTKLGVKQANELIPWATISTKELNISTPRTTLRAFYWNSKLRGFKIR